MPKFRGESLGGVRKERYIPLQTSKFLEVFRFANMREGTLPRRRTTPWAAAMHAIGCSRVVPLIPDAFVSYRRSPTRKKPPTGRVTDIVNCVVLKEGGVGHLSSST